MTDNLQHEVWLKSYDRAANTQRKRVFFLCYSTCKSQAEYLFQVAASPINLDCHIMVAGLSFSYREGIACCGTDKRDPVTGGI